jgi:hypothetical protein
MSDKKDDFVEIKPLSEDDIDKLRERLLKLSDSDFKKIEDICVKYKQLINGLISTARKQTKEEDEIVEIERLKRLLGLCSCDELFYRSKDKIWSVRNKLINKDLDWFVNRDYSKLIKKDSKTTLIETLVDIIKDKIANMSLEERDIYWNKGLEMLLLVGQFKKITGEGV